MPFDQLFSNSSSVLTTDTNQLAFLSSTQLPDSNSSFTSLTTPFAAASSAPPTDVQLPISIPDSQNLDNLVNANGNIEVQSSIESGSDLFYLWDTSNSVNVSLTDIPEGRDVDLQLLNSVGQQVALSANPGNSNESIDLADLPPDVYLIRVYTASTAPASTFTLRASNNDPPNLLARENDAVPSLNNTLTFNGSVSSEDTSDIFRFQLPSAGTFEVDLTQLGNRFVQADPNFSDTEIAVGVRVIQRLNTPGNQSGFIDGDEILADIFVPGPITSSSLVFTTPNLPQADYWVQVYAIGGDVPVSYSLQLTNLSSASNQPSSQMLDAAVLPTVDLTGLDTV